MLANNASHKNYNKKHIGLVMDELILISQHYEDIADIADILKAEGIDSLEKISQSEPADIVNFLNIENYRAEEIVRTAARFLSEKTDVTDRLSSIKGVGKNIAGKLWLAGYKSIENIASARPEDISDSCQIPLATCEKIVAAVHAESGDITGQIQETQESGMSSDESQVPDDVAEIIAELETEPVVESDETASDEEDEPAVSPEPESDVSGETDTGEPPAASPEPESNASRETDTGEPAVSPEPESDASGETDTGEPAVSPEPESDASGKTSNIEHQTSSIKHQELNTLVSEDSPRGETDTTNYVSFLEGLDKRTTEELWKAGFRSVESVASADPEEIAEKCPISISLCKGIVVIARTKLKDEEAMLKMLNGQERKNPSDLSEVSGDVADGAEEEFPMDTISRRQLARMIVKELF